jgi:hypothetical protein
MFKIIILSKDTIIDGQLHEKGKVMRVPISFNTNIREERASFDKTAILVQDDKTAQLQKSITIKPSVK